MHMQNRQPTEKEFIKREEKKKVRRNRSCPTLTSCKESFSSLRQS